MDNKRANRLNKQQWTEQIEKEREKKKTLFFSIRRKKKQFYGPCDIRYSIMRSSEAVGKHEPIKLNIKGRGGEREKRGEKEKKNERVLNRFRTISFLIGSIRS